MNAKTMLQNIEDELDSRQVFVKLRLKWNGEVEVESTSPIDRLIAIAELKKRGIAVKTL